MKKLRKKSNVYRNAEKINYCLLMSEIKVYATFATDVTCLTNAINITNISDAICIMQATTEIQFIDVL